MEDKKTCFVIMPLKVREVDMAKYDDENHWTEVYNGLIRPAFNETGIDCERDDEDHGSRLIFEHIIHKIETCDLILCDLSSKNPNVFLELGWAFRANKPYVLIQDEQTNYEFDLNQNNIFQYSSRLQPSSLAENIPLLSDFILHTINDKDQRYSLVKKLSIAFAAINPMNDNHAQLALLKQIEERLRYAPVENSDFSKEKNFPWPSLLQTSMNLLEQITNLLKKATSVSDVLEIVESLMMTKDLRFKKSHQISVLTKDRKFLYHDWAKFLGTKASYTPIEGFDIYNEIFKYSDGVVAWTDHGSNMNELIFSRIRSNIAIYRLLDKFPLKIVVESHFENKN